MTRVAAIVLARLDSKRLPGKALRVVAGRSLIDYVFDACRGAAADDVVLATSDRSVDDELAAHGEAAGVHVFRGDVNDVAGRFLGAMEAVGADAGLRVNGDSPLHRAQLLREGIDAWRAGGADLVSNVPGRTWPFGWSVEVVGIEAMRRAVLTMTSPLHREHVTKRFYDEGGVALRTLPPGPLGGAGLQLAVDDATDLARFAWMVERCGSDLPSMTESALIALAQTFPDPQDAHVA